MLARDILSREGAPKYGSLSEGARKERAPSSGLSFCWKAFDFLMKQLDVARTDMSSVTCGRFTSTRWVLSRGLHLGDSAPQHVARDQVSEEMRARQLE